MNPPMSLSLLCIGQEDAKMQKIIRAEKKDLQEILDLQYLAYQSEAALVGDNRIPPLTQALDSLTSEFERGIILKAMDDSGQIIGSVRAYLRADTAYIGRLIVHPAYQGNGIGTQLLIAIENKYLGKRYELFTSSKSVRNIALYQRLGYHVFKQEKVTVDLSMVYMEKSFKEL